MKKINFTGMMIAACSLLAASCSQENPGTPTVNNNNGDKVEVRFALDADNDLQVVSRAFIPVESQFQILAFRSNEGSFMFDSYVQLDGMSIGSDGHLTGSAYFTPGTYKFLANYGLSGSTSSVSQPTWTGKHFTNDTYMTNTSLSGAGLPEIFMGYDTGTTNPTTDADYFGGGHTYTIAADGSVNEVVEISLFRAVARVDVQLIHARNTGTAAQPVYEEVVYQSSDVLGGVADVENIRFAFKNLNDRMSYVATIPAGSGALNQTFSLSDMQNTIKIGTATSTTAVKDSFYEWDNVTPSVIGQGNAHIVGPYLLPVDPAATTKPTLALTFTHRNDPEKVRIIPAINNLPLDRNKVTIVKIYVLGPDIFHTNVKFDVEVDQVWDTPNEVDDIIIN